MFEERNFYGNIDEFGYSMTALENSAEFLMNCESEFDLKYDDLRILKTAEVEIEDYIISLIYYWSQTDDGTIFKILVFDGYEFPYLPDRLVHVIGERVFGINDLYFCKSEKENKDIYIWLQAVDEDGFNVDILGEPDGSRFPETVKYGMVYREIPEMWLRNMIG